jgi:ribonuclease BN (tRNA processing enzyme)
VEVRLLGTGGWVPTDKRETSCVYLRSGSEVLLLDAGSGARRLVTEPHLMERVERVSVAFSHFHLDHVSGVAALAGMDARRELWMPAELLAGIPASELLDRLVAPPFFTGRAEVGEARELAGETQIGPFGVEIRVQPQHPGRSIAIKVDGVLTYCTDTRFDSENIGFARGSRVLLHESFRPGETTDDPGHTASGEAGRIAAEAGVERLVLVHVDPEGPEDDELVAAARDRFPASEVGRDGLVVM